MDKHCVAPERGTTNENNNNNNKTYKKKNALHKIEII